MFTIGESMFDYDNIKLRNRRSVAPVIATLLMVAIAVVGGMLVFVFAQDFFTQTESMTGPTIEQLQIYGYDFRDVGSGKIKSHDGIVCLVITGTTLGTMADADHAALFVRNHGNVPVFIDQVTFFGGPSAQGVAIATMAAATPPAGDWVVVDRDDTAECLTSTVDSPVLPGEERTILVGWDEDFCDPVCNPKVGRPIFVAVTTDAGNVFTKTVINGRAVG